MISAIPRILPPRPMLRLVLCSLCAYFYAVLLVTIVVGIHRGLGFLYTCWRNCMTRPSRSWPRYRAELEDLRRVAPPGVVGESRCATVATALRGRGIGTARFGRGGSQAHVDETLTYVTNNRQRMDYPEYHRLGHAV